MKPLLFVVLLLIPLPVRSQMWVEFYRENIKEDGIWNKYSRDIDLQSIIKRGGYHYVNVRYWSNHTGSETTSKNQSIFNQSEKSLTKKIKL